MVACSNLSDRCCITLDWRLTMAADSNLWCFFFGWFLTIPHPCWRRQSAERCFSELDELWTDGTCSLNRIWTLVRSRSKPSSDDVGFYECNTDIVANTVLIKTDANYTHTCTTEKKNCAAQSHSSSTPPFPPVDTIRWFPIYHSDSINMKASFRATCEWHESLGTNKMTLRDSHTG